MARRSVLLTRAALVTGILGTGVLATPHAPIHAATAPAGTGDELTVSPPQSIHAPGQLRVERYGPQDTNHPRHGLGLAGVTGPTGATPATSAGVSAGTAPASVDLSQYAPPVGDQGSVNSCVAWATIYGLRGWYANRDGYYPTGGAGSTGSFAPMYTYAQIVKGQNVGTTFNDNLNLALSQGVDTRADYTQGDYDYTDQPTASETSNATHFKIASWSNLSTGSGAQAAIENAMSSGNPVALGIPVYSNFYNAGSTSYYVDVPTVGMTNYGNHGIFAIKYDSNGVWIQNSWGTGWGLNGTAELSWAFVTQYAWQIVEMTPSNPSPVATSTPAPTNTPAPTTTVAPASDFSLSSDQTALAVSRGSTLRDTLTLQGLSGTVTVSFSGLPGRTSGSLSLNPVSLNGQTATTALSISAARKASPGTYTLTINASDGAYAHSLTLPLTIS